MKKLFIIFLILFPLIAFGQTKIKMQKENGVYLIPCKVNGLDLKFIFDTGASNVHISLTEAKFMLKNGYLSPEDLGGTVYTSIASGDIVENTEVVLREIEIGGFLLKNIGALVSSTQNAPLLLGQSAIQQLGEISLQGDYLIINSAKKISPKGNTQSSSYESMSIAELKELLKTDSKKGEVYQNIADHYHKNKQDDEAIEWCERCIRMCPEYTDIYFTLE